MQPSPSGSNRVALSIISDRINKICMTKVQKNLVNPVEKSSLKFFLTVFFTDYLQPLHSYLQSDIQRIVFRGWISVFGRIYVSESFNFYRCVDSSFLFV